MDEYYTDCSGDSVAAVTASAGLVEFLPTSLLSVPCPLDVVALRRSEGTGCLHIRCMIVFRNINNGFLKDLSSRALPPSLQNLVVYQSRGRSGQDESSAGLIRGSTLSIEI